MQESRSESYGDGNDSSFRFALSPGAIRIFALQLLFMGLLFLPDLGLSASGFKWTDILGGAAEVSRLVQTLGFVLSNPAFYILLTISALIFSFSFEMREEQEEGTTMSSTVGATLLRALGRILFLYACLFLASWIFLTYKLMFMGTIYINPIIFKGL
ncbi:MAG TPA: hypothetical protein PKX87_07360 [Alphaproteobacteria bacterium]|mgnify:CR=1 FL=1|nr:hypothetical protein [Alphaproteobacteria bacterium]